MDVNVNKYRKKNNIYFSYFNSSIIYALSTFTYVFLCSNKNWAPIKDISNNTVNYNLHLFTMSVPKD